MSKPLSVLGNVDLFEERKQAGFLEHTLLWKLAVGQSVWWWPMKRALGVFRAVTVGLSVCVI